MPKINQEEYEVLKGLDDRWKWIARNYNGALITYMDKPMKNPNLYWDSFGERMDDRLFQFIQWEDSEPYNIAELIEGYEYLALERHVNSFKELSNAIRTKESEETEVKKDKQWLRDRYESMETIKVTTKNSRGKRSTSYLKKKTVINLLNQLDDPETTIHEAHDKIREVSPLTDKSFDYYWNAINDGVEIDEPLGNSQELEKVQIPQFVAEVIEEHKERGYDVYDSIDLIIETNGMGLPSISDWIARNIDKYARAWLYGFIVEEEKKYYALIKGHELFNDSEDSYWNVDGEELYIDNNWHDYSGYKTTKLTKDEWENLGINEDNADFIKVEELEE